MELEAARGEDEDEEEFACLLMISRDAVGRCEFAENGDRLVAEGSLRLKERRIRQEKLIHRIGMTSSLAYCSKQRVTTMLSDSRLQVLRECVLRIVSFVYSLN